MHALKSFLSYHQRKMTLLEDNRAGALYNYLISVQTGHRKNAGTSANVIITDEQQTTKTDFVLKEYFVYTFKDIHTLT